MCLAHNMPCVHLVAGGHSHWSGLSKSIPHFRAAWCVPFFGAMHRCQSLCHVLGNCMMAQDIMGLLRRALNCLCRSNASLFGFICLMMAQGEPSSGWLACTDLHPHLPLPLCYPCAGPSHSAASAGSRSRELSGPRCCPWNPLCPVVCGTPRDAPRRPASAPLRSRAARRAARLRPAPAVSRAHTPGRELRQCRRRRQRGGRDHPSQRLLTPARPGPAPCKG